MNKLYNLALGAIFKNEAPYLEEWINHHLNRGVDHIYLINDYSNDEYASVLEPYIKQKYITLFNNNLNNFKYGRQAQIYNLYFLNLREAVHWFGIIDIDEYLWSPKVKNLNLILNPLKETWINGIIIWSLVFGGNELLTQPKSIVDSFIKRQDIKSRLKNMNLKNHASKEYLFKKFYYKQIIRMENVIEFGIHNHIYHNFKKSTLILDPNEIDSNILRINHYKTQSKDKWLKKMNDTDVNSVKPEKLSDIEPFREEDLYNFNIKNIMSNHGLSNHRKVQDMYIILDQIYNDIIDLKLKEQNL